MDIKQLEDNAEPYMEVYKGQAFTLSEIDSHDYKIEVIAHALSNLCRYGGHCRSFYSVAEHSVLMADWVWEQTDDAKLAYEALMHDSAEAYMGDMPRPVKYTLPDYRKMLGKVETAIAKQFGFSDPTPTYIKELDARIIVDERKQVMLPSDNVWMHDKLEPLGVTIWFDIPTEAEQAFLDAYEFYRPMNV